MWAAATRATLPTGWKWPGPGWRSSRPQDRHDLAKRASDAWDLYRLLDSNLADPNFAGSFRDAPPGLVPLIDAGIDRLLRQGVTQTRRRIVTYGDPSWAALATEDATEDAIDQIADAFLVTLRRA